MTRLPLAVVLLVLVSSPAYATFIDLGNGMVYDTVQDLTWLQDGNYAHTSGADDDGRFTYSEAHSWAESLTFGGYDDWRLPQMRRLGLHHGSDSEISTLMAELGGYWLPPSEGQMFPVDYVIPQSTIPFVNVTFSYWLEPPVGTTPCTRSTLGGCYVWLWWGEIDLAAFHAGFDRPSSFAWAVRDGGNPQARVPEPSTVAFLTIGASVAALARRRRASGEDKPCA